MSQLLAFLRRDLIDATSYKVAFGYQVASLASSILTVYFLSRMVAGGQVPSLSPYGGDYFSFAIIGTALADYLTTSLSGFSRGIRLAQTVGTLEAMLATPASPAAIVVGSALYRFLWSLLRIAVYLFSAVLLGATFGDVNLLAAVLTLALAVVAFASVGMLGASLILVLKAWEPVTSLFAGLSVLLGGVLYPVSSLPEAAQWLAAVLPITHALEAMRGALLMGRSIAELWLPLTVLAGFTAAVLPVAAWSFQRALRHMRVQGSVSHY